MGKSLFGRVTNLVGTGSRSSVRHDSATTLSMPLFGSNSDERNMAAYGQVGTLYSVVDLYKSAVSRVEWTLYRRSTTGDRDDRTPVARHAALDLWRQPNFHYTEQSLVEAVQQHAELTGKGVILVGYSTLGKGIPLELWPIRPDRIRAVPDPVKFIAGYVYTGPNGEQIPLEVHEVLRMRYIDPLDPLGGIGPTQTVLTELDSTKQAAEWNRNFFRNSATPGGVIEMDEELSDPEFDKMRQRWDEQHKGTSKAHRVAILEHGKWVPTGFSQKDMEFSKLRSDGRDSALEAFGAHKTMLGITEDVNRANAEAGEVVTARWRIVPRLDRWKELRNQSLRLWPGAFEALEWDYENPVPPDREADNAELTAKTDALVKLVREAGVDMAGALEYLGLPPLAEGNAGKLSPQLQADMIQSIYLGVNTVVTWEEARAILISAGIDLDPNLPAPSPPAPGPGFGGAPDPDGGGDGGPTLPDDALPSATARARHGLRPGRLRTRFRLEDGGPEYDLADVQGDWESHLDALLVAWSSIAEAQRDALVAQVKQLINDGDVAGLTALAVDEADHGTDVLNHHMEALAAEAAHRVVEEADSQGVKADPVLPAAETLSEVATVSAGLLAAGLALSAGREALRVYQPGASGQEVANAVNAFLKTLTDAAAREQLGGALTGAQNAARLATLAAAPTSAMYATEVLDRNTCSPCKRIDGTHLGASSSTADVDYARSLYPVGGYVKCEGRNRCRGTVVGIWK